MKTITQYLNQINEEYTLPESNSSFLTDKQKCDMSNTAVAQLSDACRKNGYVLGEVWVSVEKQNGKVSKTVLTSIKKSASVGWRPDILVYVRPKDYGKQKGMNCIIRIELPYVTLKTIKDIAEYEEGLKCAANLMKICSTFSYEKLPHYEYSISK